MPVSGDTGGTDGEDKGLYALGIFKWIKSQITPDYIEIKKFILKEMGHVGKDSFKEGLTKIKYTRFRIDFLEGGGHQLSQVGQKFMFGGPWNE
ncbi:hypothetical protein QJS04_geneDACA010919 [Acorus gramineus]|uniref:Uncharacterized protein n=1 Tax=Acorus gramineus TaxID=55184 RepID=A0AAV9BK13_ACOGR|nr:hypothetical protein QJS04_geneDACA010919 [Acorus gramineus]